MENIKYFYETEDYRVIKTNHFRRKKKFAYFPIFFKKRFYWLQNVKITQRKYIEQFAEFDDGWSYKLVWQKPYDNWKTIKIVKLKN